MNGSAWLADRWTRTCLCVCLFATLSAAARAQAHPDFSGHWIQDNDRSQPKRNGSMTLRIEHQDPDFIVETLIARGSQNPRHAVQQYTTDGKISITRGADGDEFQTAQVWKDASLALSIEEHEDGRILAPEFDALATDDEYLEYRTSLLMKR